MRNRRLARHTVKKMDTAASIGKQYGLSAQEVARLVPTLRPGQVLSVQQRTALRNQTEQQARMQDDFQVEQADLSQYNEQRRLQALGQGYQGPDTGGGGLVQPGIALPTSPFLGQFAQYATGAMPMVMRVLSRFGQLSQQPTAFDEAIGGLPDWQVQAAQELEELGPKASELEESIQFKLATGQEIPVADLAKYNQMRTENEPIFEQMAKEQEQAQLDWGNFASGMRYTGQALSLAYDAMESGDPDWKRFISAQNITDEFGNDLTGQVVMAITDGRWDYGPMWENFSPEMREKIQAMGFVETEPGLWMMPTLEPADYGMGGYEFPGFGGFGGGGDYKYLSRGGEARRLRGGGQSTGERYRVFPEGVSPAHWRI
jgi:hypothetical protein